MSHNCLLARKKISLLQYGSIDGIAQMGRIKIKSNLMVPFELEPDLNLYS